MNATATPLPPTVKRAKPRVIFDQQGVTLYRGDCLDVLRSDIPQAHCVVTSPPYNQKLNKLHASGMHAETKWVANTRAKAYQDDLHESDYQQWQLDVLDLVHGATAPDASMFYNHKLRYRASTFIHPLQWIVKSKWICRQELIWARNGGVTFNARMFVPNDERIYWLRKDRYRFNNACATHFSVWKLASIRCQDHPCTYPVELAKRCIEATTEPGDLVLDPFMGHATTAIACIRTGRRFIGCELDPTFAKNAKRRVTDELKAAGAHEPLATASRKK